MPQGDYIELHRRRHGRRLDHEERLRKREAREPRRIAERSRTLTGIRAKLHNRERFRDKVRLRKAAAVQAQRQARRRQGAGGRDEDGEERRVVEGALPAYLLDREETQRAKILSNTIKEKRKEKGGKWSVPLPRVRPLADDEIFRVVRTGKKSKKREWKRMVTKMSFVGDSYTRKPPKYERFIRPMGLRVKRANVTHPELKATFSLDIIGVKKNPSGPMYTQLGVVTRGTIVEVNVSELGLVTTSGKVVWGKYAQVTNNPEVDGTVNAVLLV
ncbi:hypothetical protein CDCA_CDCA20G4811 [Cyanidium caldarium]|uniref:Ribosome biogenesis protein NSA2 homolog n=1 Tax=Cyanidium caldarium TaxID=2771 RepID=A0AAV9J2Y7_CYACA|nr:hypothetical protein CDCA_CDCA20G4811 [Cyanidium caldarium]